MGLACRILQETVGSPKRAASPYGINLWGNPERTFRRVIRRLRPRPLFSLARPWFSRNYRLGYDQIGQPWIWLEPIGCDSPLIAASWSTSSNSKATRLRAVTRPSLTKMTPSTRSSNQRPGLFCTDKPIPSSPYCFN